MKISTTLLILLISCSYLSAQESGFAFGIQSGIHRYKLSDISNNSWSPIPYKWGTNILIDANVQLSNRIGLSIEGGYYVNELNKAGIRNVWNKTYNEQYNTQEKGSNNPKMFTIVIGPSFSVGKKINLSFIPYFGFCFQQAAMYAVDYTYPAYNFTVDNQYKVDAKTNFIIQPTIKIGYNMLKHWRVSGSCSLMMLNSSYGTYYAFGKAYPISPTNTYASSDLIAFNFGLAYRL